MAESDHRSTILQLSRDRLAAGELLKLKVVSASMWPLLRPGDWVIVTPLDESVLCYGDLLVLEYSQEWITHRLVGRQGERWLTKGDNLWGFDPPVAAGQFLGRVIAVKRGAHVIEDDLCTPRRRVAARLLARWSGWEGRLMQAAPRRPWRYAARLVALPIRGVAWLLASFFWRL